MLVVYANNRFLIKYSGLGASRGFSAAVKVVVLLCSERTAGRERGARSPVVLEYYTRWFVWYALATLRQRRR